MGSYEETKEGRQGGTFFMALSTDPLKNMSFKLQKQFICKDLLLVIKCNTTIYIMIQENQNLYFSHKNVTNHQNF